MTEKLKNIALFIALAPLVLLSLIIALAAFIVCVPYLAWVRLMRIFRRDPRIKFKQLTDLPDLTTDTDSYIKQYFKNLVKEISNQSDASIKALPTKRTAWKKVSEADNEVTYREVTYSEVLTSRHATLKISLVIEEHDGANGKEYFSHYDGDDEAMGGNIGVEVLEPQLSTLREYTIDYDQEHAWLSIALLTGGYKISPSTSQLWAHVEQHDVWLVQYKPNGKLGLRKAYSAGQARRLWLDSKRAADGALA